jgi:hypothetical protein
MRLKPLKTYPPERVEICSHHLIIHAKAASTSLRGCGKSVHQFAAWDRPTVALIRNPLERWISGYTMYLADLSRHLDGHLNFIPPRHFVYDVHTAQQAYKVRKDTHLIRFEDINEYADRCQFSLPHLNHAPFMLSKCKADAIQWMKDNEVFKHQLKHHLRFDYKLREKCVSVQSLPENLFIK